jgi:hypothetical protein
MFGGSVGESVGWSEEVRGARGKRRWESESVDGEIEIEIEIKIELKIEIEIEIEIKIEIQIEIKIEISSWRCCSSAQ